MTAQRGTSTWPLLLIAYVAIVAVLIVRVLYHLDATPLLADTDDAMRMTVVRDFLNGQNWFDIVQHRLNTPHGAEIHWSRLIDVPIAALVLLFRPVAGAMADNWAAFVYPLLLLFVLLVVSVKLCVRLVGPEGVLPAVALPAFSPSIMAEFTPGRIDHHNVQIILTLVIAWCCVEALKRPRFAIAAGIACATALAIGTEAVPCVASAILAFGIAWALRPAHARLLRGFGLSFAVSALVHMAIALPPSRWLVPACDALSIVYVAAAIGVALLFGFLSVLPMGRQSCWQRLLVGALAGIFLLALLLVLFPNCMGGPYAAVDPWLVHNWLDQVTEARPAWESLIGLPAYTVAAMLPILGALVVIAWRLWRRTGADLGEWAVVGLFLLLAVLVACVQIRGARIAGIVAVPVGAWLIVTARHHYLARQRPLQIAGLIGSWLLFAGIAIFTAIASIGQLIPSGGSAMTGSGALTAGADPGPCLMPQAFAPLAAMPPARIMTPIDLGSHMLLNTAHSVVSAPYHRDQQGVLDTFRFFNGPIDAARFILQARGVTMVVTCPALPEMRGLADATADSFIRLSAAQALPAWLKDETPPGSPLRIYAVLSR
ncbi:MAG TPA: hypothetical protein VGM83_12360 [Devosiaceae bacterium]|jgi:hypothetical protein